jgi:hypothetical protein
MPSADALFSAIFELGLVKMFSYFDAGKGVHTFLHIRVFSNAFPAVGCSFVYSPSATKSKSMLGFTKKAAAPVVQPVTMPPLHTQRCHAGQSCAQLLFPVVCLLTVSLHAWVARKFR